MERTSERMDDVSAQRWAWASIGVNVLLLGLSGLVAALSGSLAVGAEAVHNGVDLISAVAVLAGIKLATRKSRDFPYGLYKLENIIAVAVAGLIFLSAYEIVRQAVLGTDRRPSATPWMFAVLAVSLAVPAVFSRFELRAGRRLRSPALIADAREYRVHVLTTGIAVAALAGSVLEFPVDRVAAVIIVVPVAKTGWDLLVEGVRVLLDVSLEPEALETIRRTALADPTVVGVTSVTGRNAGRFRFVEITLELRSKDLEHADTTAHRIERRIREEIGNVERVLIHVDPKRSDHLRCAAPLADERGRLAEHFGGAPWFALSVIRLSDGTVTGTEILKNPHLEAERSKGIEVAEWLVERKVDIVVMPGEPGGKGPVYVLAHAAVTIHRTESSTLSEALDEVIEAARLQPSRGETRALH